MPLAVSVRKSLNVVKSESFSISENKGASSCAFKNVSSHNF